MTARSERVRGSHHPTEAVFVAEPEVKGILVAGEEIARIHNGRH